MLHALTKICTCNAPHTYTTDCRLHAGCSTEGHVLTEDNYYITIHVACEIGTHEGVLKVLCSNTG